MRNVIWAGLALGVLSRVEEVTPGFSLGLSSDGAWLAAAFVAGLLASSRPALRGVAVLTAANAGYYLFIALTQSGAARTGIADVAGYWFALGVGGGIVFGLVGALASRRVPVASALAWLVLAGALAAEGGSAVSRGNPGGAVELTIGCAIALGLAGRTVAVATGAIAAVALTGVLVPLVP